MNILKKLVGVCIMRIQTPFLTLGHRFLIDYTNKNSDELVVILGVAPTMLEKNNPLTFEMRKDMVETLYPNAIILPLKDTNDDGIWSNELDNLLIPFENDNVVIYGGRDSFIPYYLGKHKVFDIGETEFDNINATEFRNKLKEYKNLHDVANELLPEHLKTPKVLLELGFRCGVIWASQNKFPTAFATVDVAVIRLVDGVVEILLGRKPKQNVWVMIGGFVDKEDENYLCAANRELSEEIKGIKTTELKFINSFKIDDWRYRKSENCIITNLHICRWVEGEPIGADDLEEAKFFSIKQAYDFIGEHHKNLLRAIESNINLIN
jgi:bifunctional NMN adenylyltransferase/nudix hydrolase